MKKILMISLDNNNYLIKSDQGKELTINGEDLILSGKGLYDAFFSDVDLEEFLELNVVIDKGIVGSRELYIAKQISKIIEGIVTKINDMAVDATKE